MSDTTDHQMDHLRQQIEIESSRAESLEKQKKSMQETIASLAEREVTLTLHFALMKLTIPRTSSFP